MIKEEKKDTFWSFTETLIDNKPKKDGLKGIFVVLLTRHRSGSDAAPHRRSSDHK